MSGMVADGHVATMMRFHGNFKSLDTALC